MDVSKCRRCHQTIWFGETEKGKKMPINTWTSPKGKIVAIDPEADVPMVQHLKKDDPEPEEGTPRYVAHMATCRRR